MKSYTTPAKRDLIFISHANPEDNEFAKWLALRLAAEGYPVFCEIVDLLGGEDPWKDIEQVIRQRAVKFLFVLTNISKDKNGTRKELNLADQVARKESLEDFIIPLKIESVPHYDVNIELQTTLTIPFEEGWAKGLNQLIEKLEQQKVEKDPKFNPDLVSSWWRNHFSAEKGLEDKPEDLISNWFEIDGLPNKLYYHYLKPGEAVKFEPPENGFLYPFKEYGKGIVSFANAVDFPDGEQIFGDKFTFYLDNLLKNDHANTFLSAKDSRNTITDLLRQAWENLFIQRNLSTYTLANKSKFCYFKKDQILNDKIHFTSVYEKKTWRSVIGYKTIGENKRYWHFGISAKPLFWGRLFFSVSPHVLFSNDGEAIWDDPARLHKAKMSQCRNWWNPQWRDRIRAVMNFLAEGKETIPLTLGSTEDLIVNVNNYPVQFTIPVSLLEEKKDSKNKVAIDDDLDDETDINEEFGFEDEDDEGSF